MKDSPYRRSEIHLGDLIRALTEIPWQTQAEADKIAATLGFRLQHPEQNQVQHLRSAPTHISKRKPASQTPKHTNKPRVTTPPAPAPKLTLPDEVQPATLTIESQQAPPQVDFAVPEGDYEYYDETEHCPVSPPSLFTENQSRGLLTALLQTTRESNRIDTHQLIREFSHSLIPQHLPYESEGTLENGCQLLLDYSDSMIPWWDDLGYLAQQVQATVGKTAVTEYQFSEDPQEAICWTENDKAIKWQAIADTPCLVVTDFRLPASRSEYRLQQRWQPFISRCEAKGSPLIFLVPWEINRWLSKNLGGYPYVFTWSPETSASQIRSVVGVGHQVES